MVSFNGVNIETITGVKILNVQVNAPQVTLHTVNPPLRDGTIYAAQALSSRTVVVSLVIPLDTMSQRETAIKALQAWATSQEPAQLIIPQSTNAYLTAKCSAFPQYSARDWWEPLEIEFTAFDPFFYSTSINSVDVGQPVIVTSKYAPNWKIEQTVSTTLVSPTWTLNSQFITFSSVTAGALVVEYRTKTATLDGNSALPALMLGSRFFDLQQGTNTITTSGGAGGTIIWRERWL